ncbi:MAG: hypothetical protein KJ630_23755 [Proteobacteria bacterium]|nr:hypothetical protein [Pseudomonadota bacterium]
MKEVILTDIQTKGLEEVYKKLQDEYQRVAQALCFSCNECPDNCCDSYFLHHTYAEWAFLWIGFRQLDAGWRSTLLKRSREWLEQCEKALAVGERPQVMCPLNNDGLCVLYKHRLLVCRTHGVPARITRPDGQELRFPGCFRCQEIVADKYPGKDPPHVARTQLLHTLALLENQLLEGKRHLLPKVRITIAEMLVNGPPALPYPHCQRNLAKQAESEGDGVTKTRYTDRINP